MPDFRLVRYRGRYYAGRFEPGYGTRRIALRTADRATAEARLSALAATPAGDRIADIMAAYLTAKEAEGIASIGRRREAWKAAEPHFATLTPGQVTEAVCRAYRAKRGVGDGTIRTELATVRAGVLWHDKRSPAVFWLPPSPPPRERALTREEYGRLVEACEPTHHLKTFVVLCVQTAARPRDILGMTWRQVDFERGLIRLGGDVGNKRRATVPMTERARLTLLEAREAALSDYIIEWGGGRVASIKKAFRSAAAKAGMPEVTPYVLRHTAAVWMAEAGVPMSEIAQMMGHSSTRVTERVYARYSPDYLRKAAEALG